MSIPDDQFVYDFTFMMSELVGEHGATEAELAELQPRMVEIQDKILELKDNNELGFAQLPYATETLKQVQDMANQVRGEFSTLVVLGIGGSDLGARAVHGALNHTYFNELSLLTKVQQLGGLDNKAVDEENLGDDTEDGELVENDRGAALIEPGPRIYFAGDNTDPKALADLVDMLDLETTAINVISKSGDTIETMSSFVYLRQRLAEAVGEENVADQIIVSTDAEKGSLRAIVDREGYRSLAVPANVGGRFSVLSTVGLFPLAYAGINIEDLLAGAYEMDERLGLTPAEKNPAMLFAALHYLGNTKRRQNISVMMPYASGLRGMGQWYRQLWAESLGKAKDAAGQTVNVGQTPVAAVGATDQHSQVQLYIEGPFDKLITLVTVTESDRNVLLTDDLGSMPELSYLQGVELNDVFLTEAKSTAMALAHNGRPNGTIILPRLDEYYLGQLIYFLEMACAYAGELYGVNAYDQPGVELGKQLMYAQLGKDGFDDTLKPFEYLMSPKKTYTA